MIKITPFFPGLFSALDIEATHFDWCSLRGFLGFLKVCVKILFVLLLSHIWDGLSVQEAEFCLKFDNFFENSCSLRASL